MLPDFEGFESDAVVEVEITSYEGVKWNASLKQDDYNLMIYDDGNLPSDFSGELELNIDLNDKTFYFATAPHESTPYTVKTTSITNGGVTIYP